MVEVTDGVRTTPRTTKRVKRRRSELRSGRSYEHTMRHEELPQRTMDRPRRNVGPRLFSLLLAVALASLIGYLFISDAFYVYGAVVRGNRVLSAEDLYRRSEVDGYSVFFIDPRGVEETIRTLPDIREVKAQLRLPGQLIVEVEERQPQVMWKTGEQRYGVDEEGRILSLPEGVEPSVSIRDLDGTPRRPGDHVDPKMIGAANRFSTLLPGVREFDYSQQYGLSLLDEHGWLIRLGDGEAIEAKVAKMTALVQKLANEGAKVEFIDLRFQESPYYRLLGG